MIGPKFQSESGSGGSGGSQNIQSVLGVGNVTNRQQVFDDGLGGRNRLDPGFVRISDVAGNISELAPNSFQVIDPANDSSVYAALGIVHHDTAGAVSSLLNWAPQTAIRVMTLPNSSGLVQVSEYGLVLPFNTSPVTGNYTATRRDYLIRVDATGGNFTITLPAAGASLGQTWIIKNVVEVPGGIVTVVMDVGTIDGNPFVNIDCLKPHYVIIFTGGTEGLIVGSG